MLHGEPTGRSCIGKMIPDPDRRRTPGHLPRSSWVRQTDKPTRRADQHPTRASAWNGCAVGIRHLDPGRRHTGRPDRAADRQATPNIPERFVHPCRQHRPPTGDFPMPEIWWQFRQHDPVTTDDHRRDFVQWDAAVHAGACRVRRPVPTTLPVPPVKRGAMPGLKATSPDDLASPANRAAWTVLRASETPALAAFSEPPGPGQCNPIFERASCGAHRASTIRTIRNAGSTRAGTWRGGERHCRVQGR